jgi:hypothetical protein
MSKIAKGLKRRKMGASATYRVLAKQPLSLEVDGGRFIENLSIQGVSCRIAITPVHPEPDRQRSLGGSLFTIEFQREHDADPIVVAREGVELIEDFLSALTLSSGPTFGPSRLVEVARLIRKSGTCEFMQFPELPAHQWSEPITAATLSKVRDLLAHWDGLESGKRLRRAARRYRDAAGNTDDIAAFQQAYVGLEAMEPPLAKMVGLTPGTEEIKGSCEQCGAEYIRKRTALVGVRAFALASVDPAEANDQRKADWSLMNKLRNDLAHGLVDANLLAHRPHDAFIACMHCLHDAISICSHAADDFSEQYRLRRGTTPYVIAGTYEKASWGELSEWSGACKISSFEWVPHAKYGLVPELKLYNSALAELKIGLCRLTRPMAFATMNDLERANGEMS